MLHLVQILNLHCQYFVTNFQRLILEVTTYIIYILVSWYTIFTFWNFVIVLEEFDSQLTTTFDVGDAWKWKQNYDHEIISGLTFYKLIIF